MHKRKLLVDVNPRLVSRAVIKRLLVVFLKPTEKDLIVFSAAGFINSKLTFTEYPDIHRQRITLVKCNLKKLHAMEVHIFNT